jgi:hypothetical protein
MTKFLTMHFRAASQHLTHGFCIIISLTAHLDVVKVEFKHCALKTYGGVGLYSFTILDLGTRWR